ncbi:hypothetical protein FOL47_008119 [Perkinsus chesapeaki]|uniref:PNPLA domain-containing protein n=1 Tax=Perkinsus chesapeaki TaxID=330153 RepID=A0A7J6LG07_PERCH|nr:hypothetical protein FOL47_008119 [Perkinsus chesapeaki]
MFIESLSFPRGLHGEWAGYLKLAQLALSSTDKWSEMSNEACLGLAVVACTTGLVAVGIARERQELKKSRPPMDERPTLALGGSGLRVGYMLGTVAAIRDHVDISDTRITAISGSAIGALLLSTPELDVVDVSLAVFRCRNNVVRKGLRNCYMMDVSKTAEMIVEELKTSAGLTEKMLQDRHHSKQLYFGLTSLRPWPTPVCKECPATFEEFCKVLAAVICIPPFFTQTVEVDGYPSVDGFFSRIFATPEDHDPAKVVRYCPFPALWLTFRPPARDMISSLSECVFPYGLARHIASFEEGYQMTLDFLRSGTAESKLLSLKKRPVNRLSKYMEGLRSLQALV